MKSKVEMDNTDCPRIYNIARKKYLEHKALIKCSFCPYHKKENASKKQRNWKKLRKIKYKLATMV